MNEKNPTRIPTLTRKSVEKKMEEKFKNVNKNKINMKMIVDALFESMRELIMTADPINRMEIRDFGVFEVKKTRPKPKARNLKTGEFVFVPGRRKMHFKPGKILKEFLKEETDFKKSEEPN